MNVTGSALLVAAAVLTIWGKHRPLAWALAAAAMLAKIVFWSGWSIGGLAALGYVWAAGSLGIHVERKKHGGG